MLDAHLLLSSSLPRQLLPENGNYPMLSAKKILAYNHDVIKRIILKKEFEDGQTNYCKTRQWKCHWI